ncbi:MAG TPA: SDR family oxidoreductase [Thermoanaerobaculia bacterium]|nr:SDR family oxidoreductase [Thermoanaerobaculia bacterium]
MAKRSLVVGASGQVGEHCLAALDAAGVGTYHRNARPGMLPLDMRDARQFDDVLRRTKPEVIYLAACRANVDECEQHPDETWQTNVAGVRNAVDAANRHGCKLVYLSSEYIFDGADGPYAETAAANPISVYGRQKLAAEHVMALFAHDWLIVRTTVVYSWESQGKNFLYRLINTLRAGQTLAVPADQISSPTYAPDLVRAMIDLAEDGARGVYNVAGSRVASRYEFALAAARAFDLDPNLIKPVATAELQQAAARPLTAGLLVDKAEHALGRPLLDFHAGLREMHALR